jgi:hypothetical protein
VSVDLDRLEAFYSRVDTNRGRRVVAVVTELRAARETIKNIRAAGHDGPFGEHHHPACEVCSAVAAYDQAVRP